MSDTPALTPETAPPPPPETATRADRILRPVRMVFRWLGLLLLAVMIILPAAQVFMRATIGISFIGSGELTRFMLICVVFITLPYVVSSGANIRMDELLGFLPRRAQQALKIVITATGVLGFGAAAVSVAVATLRNLNNATPTLGIPYWIFFSAAFVGLAFAAIECALQLWKALRDRPLYVGFEEERPPEDLPDL